MLWSLVHFTLIVCHLYRLCDVFFTTFEYQTPDVLNSQCTPYRLWSHDKKHPGHLDGTNVFHHCSVVRGYRCLPTNRRRLCSSDTVFCRRSLVQSRTPARSSSPGPRSTIPFDPSSVFLYLLTGSSSPPSVLTPFVVRDCKDGFVPETSGPPLTVGVALQEETFVDSWTFWSSRRKVATCSCTLSGCRCSTSYRGRHCNFVLLFRTSLNR